MNEAGEMDKAFNEAVEMDEDEELDEEAEWMELMKE